MALTATMYHVQVNLSDVDRGVYQPLDLRLARHPSESMLYLLTRTLAYCLSYEEGISFSKGGISSTDEAPISVRDPTGVLLAWIDIRAAEGWLLGSATSTTPTTVVGHAADPGRPGKGPPLPEPAVAYGLRRRVRPRGGSPRDANIGFFCTEPVSSAELRRV